MTSEAKSDASGGSQHSHHQDPAKYWGYLFKSNKCPTEKLDRLLTGICIAISKKYHVPDCHDLTPKQLASFYRDVGGNYDSLFIDNDAQTIAFIFKSLGCLHSLQPDLEDDRGYSSPSIPALKPRGFVTWQTIQILLGPQEHVPFLQNALKAYNVIDPATKQPFLKTLPASCLPTLPDHDMERWHDKVATRLQDEAEEAEERSHRHGPGHHNRMVTTATDGPATPGIDRADTTRYFSDPHHRAQADRPKIVRSFTKAAPPKLKEGGKAVALTVRNIANPYLWSGNSGGNEHGSRARRRSRDERGDDDAANYDHMRSYGHHHRAAHSSTPTRRRSPRHSSQSSTRRRAQVNRADSVDSISSDTSSEDNSPQNTERRQPRRHRSYDPPMSDYFSRRDAQRASSQYLNEPSNRPEQRRRKSDDHGRAANYGRDRARFTVSEGTQAGRGAMSPNEAPIRSAHNHRASVPHYRPTQGSLDEGCAPRTSSAARAQMATAFKDPWARDEYARGGFDHRAFRPGPPEASSAGSASSGSNFGTSGVGPPGGGSQPAHRYVTPSMPMNGVRGRAYPSGDAGYR